jgi:hypothetical protein
MDRYRARGWRESQMIALVASKPMRGIAGDHVNSRNQTRNRNRPRVKGAAVDDGT